MYSPFLDSCIGHIFLVGLPPVGSNLYSWPFYIQDIELNSLPFSISSGEERFTQESHTFPRDKSRHRKRGE